MAFGILEDRQMELVPGTARLNDQRDLVLTEPGLAQKAID